MSNAATLAEKPAHVPDDLVVDYDATGLDPGAANPADRLPDNIAALFEKHGPVFWTPRNGGHWMVGGYQSFFDLVRDTETFSNDPRKTPAERDAPVMAPVQIDPPYHTFVRGPLLAALKPDVIRALEGRIREFAKTFAQKFAAQGGGNIVPAIAEPVPVLVFLQLLGLPSDRMPEFRNLIKTLMTSPDPVDRGVAINRIAEVFGPYIEARHHKRENDLISTLMDTQIEGRPITHGEILAYCIQLFAAGLDTVVNTLSFAFYELARDQQLQETVRADPAEIPMMIEELVRRYSIVQNWRYVMRDTEFHSVKFKQYDRVLYSLTSANLDKSVYENPLEFDMDRNEKPHLGFGVGPHRCVGSHLARLEMRVAIEELLKAVPQFRLDPDQPIEPNVGMTYGLDTVSIIWN